MLSFGTVRSFLPRLWAAKGTGQSGQLWAPSRCPHGSASPALPLAAGGRAGQDPGGADRPGPAPPAAPRARSPPGPGSGAAPAAGPWPCSRGASSASSWVSAGHNFPGAPLCWARVCSPGCLPAGPPLSLQPGQAPARLRCRHGSRESKGEMITGRWDTVKHRSWPEEQRGGW